MDTIQRTTMRAVWSLVAGFIAVCAAVPAARQEPTFRASTRTVPVFVTVTDAEGRLVPDLVRDDFEIYDNGAGPAAKCGLDR